ncbi:MAG: hypothetical protein HC821_05150, partial [Lewinella sp.]|nr:hypothetical protein [Lewinella sp.]
VATANRNCTPADAETPGQIDCGYRLIEQLAPAIAGFPVQADAEGDLLTDDYAAALVAVRTWYAANQGRYQILTDTF